MNNRKGQQQPLSWKFNKIFSTPVPARPCSLKIFHGKFLEILSCLRIGLFIFSPNLLFRKLKLSQESVAYSQYSNYNKLSGTYGSGWMYSTPIVIITM
jgi:hypothetical protein